MAHPTPTGVLAKCLMILLIPYMDQEAMVKYKDNSFQSQSQLTMDNTEVNMEDDNNILATTEMVTHKVAMVVTIDHQTLKFQRPDFGKNLSKSSVLKSLEIVCSKTKPTLMSLSYIWLKECPSFLMSK
jgi:hypothetical protein